MKYKQKFFNCYVCEDEKNTSEAGLSVGSGLFTYHICKTCSRENYAIYEDKYFEDMNKEFKRNSNAEAMDYNEVLLKQKQWLSLVDEMFDKVMEERK
tara:strand:+ start:110 stop:400 length:291 start_codon:yes stop_codon:yes gene_type:complete